MQRIVFLLLAGWLVVLVGCGDEPSAGEVGDEPTDEPAAQPALPEVVSPLELLPGEVDDISEAAEPTEAPEAITPTDVEVEVIVPADNAVHRIAGRSAFPEADESLTRLIPAKKLSEEDQFSEPVDEADIPKVVPWTEAKRYVGYEITVEGKIVDVNDINEGSVNFLNFHKDWRGKFYMVVFDDLAKTLPKSVSQTFNGKTVRVTGEVEDHRGRPQIKILSMDQVEFVGE